MKGVKVVGLVLASSVALTACEALEKNELLGAGIAGLGCASISLLTGSSEKQAALAAVVCATVGYAVTKKLEDDRKEYASNEQFYNAENARLQAYNSKLSQQISSSESALADTEAQVNKLAAKSSRSAADKETLVGINSDLTKRKNKLAGELTVAKDNVDYQKGLNLHMKETNGSVSAEAESQLAKLESSVNELNLLVSSHEQQSASLGAYL